MYFGEPRPVSAAGSSESHLSEQRSGGELPPIYVALLDAYDQVVTEVNGDVLYESVASGDSSSMRGVLHNLSLNEWRNGVLKLERVQLVGQPGRDYDLVLSSHHIDPSLPDALAYLTASGLASHDILLHVHLRLCRSGEAYLDTGECAECAPDTYGLLAPLAPAGCTNCSKHAICFGGSLIGPKPGYWRSDFFSVNFVQCLNAEACLGVSLEPFNPQGDCEAGYKGTLCASCVLGFTRNSQYQCTKCPSLAANIPVLVLILLAVTVGFVVVIK